MGWRDPYEVFKYSLQYFHNSLRAGMNALIEVLLACLQRLISEENTTYSGLKVSASPANAVGKSRQENATADTPTAGSNPSFISSLENLTTNFQLCLQECEALSATETDHETGVAKLALYSATARFLDHLDMHHSIEDARVFPILAARLDISKLESDHTELERCIEDIRQLVR